MCFLDQIITTVKLTNKKKTAKKLLFLHYCVAPVSDLIYKLIMPIKVLTNELNVILVLHLIWPHKNDAKLKFFLVLVYSICHRFRLRLSLSLNVQIAIQ